MDELYLEHLEDTEGSELKSIEDTKEALRALVKMREELNKRDFSVGRTELLSRVNTAIAEVYSIHLKFEEELEAIS